MHHLEVKRQLAPGDVDAVAGLLAVAAEADGHRPLGDHDWVDLVQGGRQGFAGLVAWEPGHDHPVGYAQVTAGHTGSWAIEYVIDPHHRTVDGLGIGRDLVGSALEVIASSGGGHVHCWVPKPSDLHDSIAAASGLRRGRDLLQLRRPLPAPPPPPDLTLRPFDAERDADAWLAVNNRAFAWHPEQGGWDRRILEDRMAQPWFDAAGFLLHERDGRLAGFCWTKVHADHEPPLGEIYVIAVDPDFQGLGLGRDLVLAGLDHLARQGLPVGMLYVDASNTAAVALYEALGFRLDHLDRAYTADVAPSNVPAP